MTMVPPTKYWQIQILPIREDVKLKHRREISRAKEFFKIQFPHLNSNKSLNEISKIWDIDWSKARRIFQSENFLDIVQYRTEEVFLDHLLKSLNESLLERICQEPNYLNNITDEIREFIWNKTFKKAKSELLAGKKKMKNSLFAQIISIYFNDLREPG